MFLEDLFLRGRLGRRRISVSLLVAVIAFAACVATISGLARAAGAPQAFGQLAALVRSNDDIGGSTFMTINPGENAEPEQAATPIAQKTSIVPLPQTRADERIIHGLTMLLLALTAASGLAVWRRRLKGFLAVGGQAR